MTNEWTLAAIPFSGKQKLVVGVSGGSDSLGLLLFLLEQLPGSSRRLVVAHVNYGLRGKDSDRDEALVRKVCRRHRLPFERLKVRRFQRKVQREKRSLQDLAREIRYSFFQKLVHREKAWGAAVAHHLEDQAETVLERLLRGTGPRGLSGLRPVQTLLFNSNYRPLRIWRPLLGFSKEQIQLFLESRNMPWREDRSNKENKYRRNQIRNEILPYLSQWNPKLKEGLARIGEITSTEDIFMEGLLEPLGPRIKSRWRRRSYLCRAELFRKIPTALQRRWVRWTAEKLNPQARGLTFDRIEEVIGLWKGEIRGPRDLGFEMSAGCEGPLAFLRWKG